MEHINDNYNPEQFQLHLENWDDLMPIETAVDAIVLVPTVEELDDVLREAHAGEDIEQDLYIVVKVIHYRPWLFLEFLYNNTHL